MDYIFGYINFIDGSARGLPPAGNVFFQMKSRDTFAPIGPYLVTKDEIADPQKLPIKLWVNGEVKQSFNTDDMAHNIARCIEWVTSIHTLEPGDILATGTNHRGLSSFMDGDVVELETARPGQAALQHPRRAEAHLVAGDAAGPAAEERGRPDASADRQIRQDGMTAYLVVRAVVADPTDRAAFDHWYRTEHLPDALKAFKAQRRCADGARSIRRCTPPITGSTRWRRCRRLADSPAIQG